MTTTTTETCRDPHGALRCTLAKDHAGQHEAWGFETTPIRVWSAPSSPSAAIHDESRDAIDAQRYRFLRDNPSQASAIMQPGAHRDVLDRWVDAARLAPTSATKEGA